MSEHYRENVIGETAIAWCERCGRHTEHLIVRHSEHAGKLGHCVDPKHPAPKLSQKQIKKQEKEQKEKREPKLFA